VADTLRDEVSDWAEHLATEAAQRAIAGNLDPTPTLIAGNAFEDQLAYEVVLALARTIALVLRPTGHAGGPIGDVDGRPSHEALAAQLLGAAARDDADLVAALARAALGPDLTDRQHARRTLAAMLDLLRTQPIIRTPHGGPS